VKEDSQVYQAEQVPAASRVNKVLLVCVVLSVPEDRQEAQVLREEKVLLVQLVQKVLKVREDLEEREVHVVHQENQDLRDLVVPRVNVVLPVSEVNADLEVLPEELVQLVLLALQDVQVSLENEDHQAPPEQPEVLEEVECEDGPVQEASLVLEYSV